VGPISYTFDPQNNVDGSGHFITVGTSFQTGDPVVYSNGGGPNIGLAGGGTLTSGTTYYAIVDSNHPGRVELASRQTNAEHGTALPLLPQANTFDAKSAVDGTGHFISISGSTLKTGDTVIYNNGGGTSIGLSGGGTLTNGGTYYAIVDTTHPGQVKLADT